MTFTRIDRLLLLGAAFAVAVAMAPVSALQAPGAPSARIDAHAAPASTLPSGTATGGAVAPRVLAGVLPGGCSASGSPGDFLLSVPAPSGTRAFRLHVPPSYNPTQPLPLVLNFPGQGVPAADHERY